jgi:type VI secretion system secreted protein VgrG
MVFRFFDAPSGGNELLVDSHLASGSGAVVVSNGLFGVALGSGVISDGAGPGTYASLAAVFGQNTAVYLELVIQGETLAPRVRILTAPYAHNATHLNGRASSGFLDTSFGSQTKSGLLSLGDLTVNGSLRVQSGSPAAGDVLTSDATGLATWQQPTVSRAAAALSSLAERLRSVNAADLPFADPRQFNCSGTDATLSFSIDGTKTGDVVGFVGVDRISAPFEYLISLESSSALDPVAQLGRVGRLTIARASGSTTYSGRITEFGLAGFDTTINRWLYVARLEPKFSDLLLRSGYSVRQNQTIQTTIDSVLGAAGVAPRQFSLFDSYPAREMTVQYNESDLDFVQRLVESDGVHYHFQEDPVGDRIVFGDTNGAFPALPLPLNYAGDQVDPGTGAEHVANFHARQRTYSGTGRVRAYRITAPDAPIEQSSTAAGGSGEIYEFFAEDVDSARALARAQHMIQRDEVRRLERTGSSNAPDLRGGRIFTLTDSTAAGLGGSYLVTSVVHFALRDPDPRCIAYGNVFSAVPSTTTFRPERVTRRPVANGPITAKVTGPPGNTTFVDVYGRVKVLFSWDRTGASDETSSGWVRVAVPAGRIDERRWIPEIGDEVAVDFLQGDPDQPLVIGSLHNATRLPPSTDNSTIQGDLTVSGNDLVFGTGARVSSTANVTLQTQGDTALDDLLLHAGLSADDGSLRIFGSGTYEMRSGNGLFTFIDGTSGFERGRLDGFGTLSLDGDLSVQGGVVAIGLDGATLSSEAATFTIKSGDAETDSLSLAAGNTPDDGQILIRGASSIDLTSRIGRFNFSAGDTSLTSFFDQTNASLNEWKFGGANLDLFLGDTASDDVFVPGDFSVSGVKNFVQNHPDHADLSVVYTALEGDEAGTYTRGAARLEGGIARVTLGATFAWVTNPETGLTAHVTPRGRQARLYVESVSTGELVVRSDDPAEASAEFDYIVHGLRLGYEEYGVVQPRRMESALPAPRSFDALYAGREELRGLNASARFRASEESLGRSSARSGQLETLRASIGHVERTGDTEPDTPQPLVTTEREQPAAAAPPEPSTVADQGSRTRMLRTEEPELATSVAVASDVTLGDLLVVDRDQPTRLRAATNAADPTLVGIVAGRPGVLLGTAHVEPDTLTAAVAFTGIVTANVDAGYGSIEIGDLLTSSPTPGHAMRTSEPRAGTIVGKALEPLAHGIGKIRVLVMLR